MTKSTEGNKNCAYCAQKKSLTLDKNLMMKWKLGARDFSSAKAEHKHAGEIDPVVTRVSIKSFRSFITKSTNRKASIQPWVQFTNIYNFISVKQFCEQTFPAQHLSLERCHANNYDVKVTHLPFAL